MPVKKATVSQLTKLFTTQAIAIELRLQASVLLQSI
jgi:hypothetical protein